MQTQQVTRGNSLFDRIGGMPAVNAAVDIFYRKVINDDHINHFFRHLDLEKQAGKLKAFLAYAFGAPMRYEGKSMQAAHHHMQITESHFNTVSRHLIATLQELGIQQELIDEVVGIALSVKDDIVNSEERTFAMRA